MKARSTTVGCVLGIGLMLAFATYLQAFSVGDIVVQSRRGTPFLAEIPLTLNQQERGRGVVVTLGDHEEYQAEGIPRPEVVEHLEVSWITGARDMVLIASTVPIRESAFDLVLSVRSGQVTIVRTYHVGLPAPPSTAPRSAARPPSPLRPKPRRVAATSTNPTNPANPPRASAPPPWLQHLPERYGPVKRGTTLFGAVKALGAPRDTAWQALVIIWQANKEQFSGSNMHGLRAGAYLTIPPDLAEGITTISRREARRVVAEQWDAWQEIRRAVSGRQRVALAQQETAEPGKAPATIPSPESAPPGEETPASDAERPVAPSTVVLPAEHATPTVGTAEVQSVLQGLERLLGRRLPQAAEAGGPTTFVNATELQTALQGLEERLAQQLQETLRKATVTQQAAQLSRQSAMRKQTVLEQMLPPGSMLYILVVENALLLLLAGVILWRWFHSPA